MLAARIPGKNDVQVNFHFLSKNSSYFGAALKIAMFCPQLFKAILAHGAKVLVTNEVS